MFDLNFFTVIFTVVHLAAFLLFATALVSDNFRLKIQSRLLPESTAYQLAYIRILVCSVAFLYVAFVEDLPSIAYYDPIWFNPPGYLDLLGKDFWGAIVSSKLSLYLIEVFLLVSLFLSLIGFFTKISLPVATVLYLLEAALLRSWGKDFHSGYLSSYLLLLLCFLPCADVWSVDSKRKARCSNISYSWAVYTCFVAASIPYLQLGFSKLIAAGFSWADGRSLLHYLLTDNLNYIRYNFDFALKLYWLPTWVFTFAAASALLIEVIYPFTIFIRSLRLIIPLSVAALHLGILFIQDVLFLDFILVPLIFMPFGFFLGSKDLAISESPTVILKEKSFTNKSLLIILIFFTISFGTFFNIKGFKWPFVKFTMYAPQGPTGSEIVYRRFLIEYQDGTTEISDLHQASNLFLGEYRVDKGLYKNPVEFFRETIEIINSKRDDNFVKAIIFQRRVWDYEKVPYIGESTEDFLIYSFKVESLPVYLQIRTQQLATENLLKNPGFSKYAANYLSLGFPTDWNTRMRSLGYAFDLTTKQLALMIPSGTENTVFQDIIIPSNLSGLLEFEVSSSPRGQAIVELYSNSQLVKTYDLKSVDEVKHWQKLKFSHQIEASQSNQLGVRVILKNPSTEKAYFYQPILNIR
ncbi:MAG: hypothetical protein R3A13_07270 [Bdellovibrionota bacterium]